MFDASPRERYTTLIFALSQSKLCLLLNLFDSNSVFDLTWKLDTSPL